jgi:Mg2+ and Co2+ transporter CorA
MYSCINEAFDIHPLTIEDIQTQDTREKCDVFPNYYYVVIKSIQEDNVLYQPVQVSILVFKNCILSVISFINLDTISNE